MTSAKLLRILTLPIAALAAPKHVGPSDQAVAKWTDQQVKKILVVPAERIFDKIGWADDLLGAEKLAKASGRPLFLFTYDGNMAEGRC